MEIADNTFLNQLNGRNPCIKCGKSRKFYCYSCYIPLNNISEKLPNVKLPIKIDIIKHKHEIDGKSTSAHAPIIAPEDVKVYTYPNIPDYSKEDGVVLIFPGLTSSTVAQLFDESIELEVKENFGMPKGFNMGTLLRTRVNELSNYSHDNVTKILNRKKYTKNNLPIKKAVFIDSTWNQSRGIFKDPNISSMKTVVLQNRISQFWRHQRGSPRWFLSTVEAIHQFLLEVHCIAWGLNSQYKGLNNLEICDNFFKNVELIQNVETDDRSEYAPYNGQYDNLLFFFAYMYDLIHIYYDHNKLLSYKRPI
ncbi:tRNA-uridine aminocarboxypropyltransferase 1 isoform X2 [Condylostylus longicornis]|nr:tRNA-uridine aminocarboxypropyltransferase 1 isoform X2 [Condylostylus longicornis]